MDTDYQIPVNEVERILINDFDIFPKSIHQQYGFLCQNFIVAAGKDAMAAASHEKYIMKFVRNDDRSICAGLGLQHAMQMHLRANNINVSQPTPTKCGQTTMKYTAPNGREYVVQLLTFLEGVVLVEAILTKHDMETLASKIGRFVGRVHASLLSLQYDVSNLIGGNDYHAENALCFRSKLQYVKDEELKKLMEKHLDSFEINFIPRLQSLRRVFAHCDISNGNLIVNKRNEWEIVGLIDFEDSYQGYVVGDLGICIAYLLLQAAGTPEFDLADISTRAIKEYSHVLPLDTDEKAVLYDVVVSRVVVSYVTACEKVYFDPENEDFWRRQSLHAPIILKKFIQLGKKDLEQAWFQQI